mgnify:CR=1 FL=1
MLKKTHWFLGYNSLGIITEQERKHWLLKTDKKKSLIDPVTGDTYVGQLDNLGSDIIIETEKTSTHYGSLKQLSFDNNMDYIFDISPSAFPYNCYVNSFAFARIASINYPTNLNMEDYVDIESYKKAVVPGEEYENTYKSMITLNGNLPDVKHYRLIFKNASSVIIPFSGSNATSDVFATKWIHTSEAYIQICEDDSEGIYGEEIPIKMKKDNKECNVEFYYPLTEALQPMQLEYDGDNNYHTLGIVYHEDIGYPLFWFVCRQIDKGPHAYCTSRSLNGRELFSIGNEGNASIYHAKVYTGIDGDRDATPNDTPTSESYITCLSMEENAFVGASSDFNVKINPVSIKIDDTECVFGYRGSLDDTTFTMTQNDNWEYVDANTYKIKMSSFDSNCMTIGMNPLKSVFDIHFNESLTPYNVDTNDTGVAGIRATSGNPYSDMYHKYPYNFNEWSGLPEYLNKLEDDKIPEYMAVYAIHHPPGYSEDTPESSQTAALLFDLGKYSGDTYDYKLKAYIKPGGLPIEALNYPLKFIEFTSIYRRDNYKDTVFNIAKDWYCEAIKNDAKNEYGYEGEDLDRYVENEFNKLIARFGKDEFIEFYFNAEYGVQYTYEEFVEKLFFEQFGYNEDTSNMGYYQTYPDSYEFTEEELMQINDQTVSESERCSRYFHICREHLAECIEFWDSYNEKTSTEMVKVTFGVKITKNDMDEDKIEEMSKTQLMNCYDERDRFICKIHLRISPSGSHIDEMIINKFGEDGDVNLSEKVFKIVTCYNAAYDGSGTHDKKIHDIGLDFELHVLDEITDTGRVYVLSNDSIEYINNGKEDTLNKKPDRTAARICDIPTSIAQLTGISGLAPVSVVDPKYVRSEASYTEEDKYRLYNTLGPRWVRPNNVNYKLGKERVSDNDYVFSSKEDLDNVDIDGTPLFHSYTQLNPMVDPTTVQKGVVVESGSDYKRDDYGYIYVGGFAFQYMITKVGSSGEVLDFEISAMKVGDTENKTYNPINLSNFDFEQGEFYYTSTYGTSPATGKGRGFKCTLYIPNIEDILPKQGDAFEDLFAFVKLNDGLYLYQYDTINHLWVLPEKFAEFETTNDSSFQSPSDSLMTSMLPRRRIDLTSCVYATNKSTVNIDALCTTSFINVIDGTHTPIQTEILSNGSNAPTNNEVDFTKFYSEGIMGITQNVVGLMGNWELTRDFLYNRGVLESDCYVAIKYVSDPASIQYAIIKRSFNNVLTTDNVNVLPQNKLKYQKNINGNPSTTIVWDVPNVGPMMWVFNPNSQVHEKYHIDNERHTFYIERERLTWDNIDIIDPNNKLGTHPSLFVKDASGNDILDYDIYTNSPYHYNQIAQKDSDKIYAQPEFFKLLDKGTKKSDINVFPTGNWTCVFPRVHGFVFENDSTGSLHIPIQMQVIHDNYLDSGSRIINDETGNDESIRTLIMEDTSDDAVHLRVFNSVTSHWDII